LGKGLATRSFTSAATTISGGTLEVTSGADGGHVIFSSGGILQLDALMAFGGTISGFTLGDAIDLRGLAYTSGTTSLVMDSAHLRRQCQRHAHGEQRRGGRDRVGPESAEFRQNGPLETQKPFSVDMRKRLCPWG
jgi:hypothetical protein